MYHDVVEGLSRAVGDAAHLFVEFGRPPFDGFIEAGVGKELPHDGVGGLFQLIFHAFFPFGYDFADFLFQLLSVLQAERVAAAAEAYFAEITRARILGLRLRILKNDGAQKAAEDEGGIFHNRMVSKEQNLSKVYLRIAKPYHSAS